MARLFSIGPRHRVQWEEVQGAAGLRGKPFHPPLTDLVGANFFVRIFDPISYLSDELRTEYDFFRAGTILLVSGFLFSLPTTLTGF